MPATTDQLIEIVASALDAAANALNDEGFAEAAEQLRSDDPPSQDTINAMAFYLENDNLGSFTIREDMRDLFRRLTGKDFVQMSALTPPLGDPF